MWFTGFLHVSRDFMGISEYPWGWASGSLGVSVALTNQNWIRYYQQFDGDVMGDVMGYVINRMISEQNLQDSFVLTSQYLGFNWISRGNLLGLGVFYFQSRTPGGGGSFFLSILFQGNVIFLRRTKKFETPYLDIFGGTNILKSHCFGFLDASFCQHKDGFESRNTGILLIWSINDDKLCFQTTKNMTGFPQSWCLQPAEMWMHIQCSPWDTYGAPEAQPRWELQRNVVVMATWWYITTTITLVKGLGSIFRQPRVVMEILAFSQV